MEKTIYDELFEKVNCNVWVVFDKHGVYTARIVTTTSKSNATVFAFLHYFGITMVKGKASGGGYNRSAAAINDAASKINTKGQDETIVKFFDAMKSQNFQRELESLGYKLMAVI